MKNINKNEKYLIFIAADLSSNTLYIPKNIKDKSYLLTTPEAAMYFEYKNKYPDFAEVII